MIHYARSLVLCGAVIAVLACTDSGTAHACMMADQYRLFPVGASHGRLVALELDQFRDNDGEAAATLTWSVTPRLITYGVNGERTVVKTYKSQEVFNKAYLPRLRRVFSRALQDARLLEDFEEAKLESYLDCDYLERCNGHARSISKGKLRVTVSDRGKKRVAVVKFPTLFKKHVNAAFYLESPSSWYLTSVRVYDAGARRWALIDLGAGDDVAPCIRAANPRCIDDRRPRWKNVAPSISSSFDLEVPRHHGHNVDIVVSLDGS